MITLLEASFKIGVLEDLKILGASSLRELVHIKLSKERGEMIMFEVLEEYLGLHKFWRSN